MEKPKNKRKNSDIKLFDRLTLALMTTVLVTAGAERVFGEKGYELATTTDHLRTASSAAANIAERGGNPFLTDGTLLSEGINELVDLLAQENLTATDFTRAEFLLDQINQTIGVDLSTLNSSIKEVASTHLSNLRQADESLVHDTLSQLNLYGAYRLLDKLIFLEEVYEHLLAGGSLETLGEVHFENGGVYTREVSIGNANSFFQDYILTGGGVGEFTADTYAQEILNIISAINASEQALLEDFNTLNAQLQRFDLLANLSHYAFMVLAFSLITRLLLRIRRMRSGLVTLVNTNVTKAPQKDEDPNEQKKRLLRLLDAQGRRTLTPEELALLEEAQKQGLI